MESSSIFPVSSIFEQENFHLGESNENISNELSTLTVWTDSSSTEATPLPDSLNGYRIRKIGQGQWLLLTFLSLLIVVTIVGNVLVCLSVVLVRKLRRPQNYLLMSLAISDLLVALVVMPFAIVNELHENEWPLDPALCDLWVSADVLCCTASILNLCGISVDRYNAITSPLEYSAKSSPKRMLTAIFIVWLGSACVSLPPLLLLGNEHYDQEDQSIPICAVSQNFWYQIYATMVSFYVPLLVMVIVYVKILKVVAEKKKEMSWKLRPAPSPSSLQQHPSHRSGSSNTQQLLKKSFGQIKNRTGASNINGGAILPASTSTRHQQNIKKDRVSISIREHKASTTLGIIMTAFIVCWLPFFILALVRPFCTIYHVEIPSWVSSLFLWLGYTNSALNPVIYATLNRDFRRPFKEILCFRCSTLDSLMRREFYNHQFGDDPNNVIRGGRKLEIVEEGIGIDDGEESPTPL